MKKVLIAITAVLVLTSCEQWVSRELGGTVTIKLEPNKKLVEATWKNSNLWYLVEDMDSNYVPKRKEFIESSTVGVMEGKVVFIESKSNITNLK